VAIQGDRIQCLTCQALITDGNRVRPGCKEVDNLSWSRKASAKEMLMYQLEVKRWLVVYRFPPSEGWKVQVDVDAMERARGGEHKPDKIARARAAEDGLLALGAFIGAHPKYGRADIVAEHPKFGTYIVEVEGTSSRQKEQAVYSALGQLVLQMQGAKAHFLLAVPDDMSWEKQLRKIPPHAKATLGLSCLLVSEGGVKEV